MSEQKTAVELVDEFIQELEYGIKVAKPELERIKSAIEREQTNLKNEITFVRDDRSQMRRTIENMQVELGKLKESAITMRHISELPDTVPDGCGIALVDENEIKYSVHGATNFYILPLPVKERKLKPCPFCGSSGKPYWAIGCAPGCWWVICNKCRAIGPRKSTETKAKEAWGWE